MGGLVSLPSWASGWTPESLGKTTGVTPSEEDLLAEIVETYIPETTTPGAKSLKVHQFVLRMIQDCYGEPAQTTIKQGLQLTDQAATQLYTKAFMSCDPAQRKDVLTRMAASEDQIGRQFVGMTKGLTIQGYTNSEYYLTNVAKFNMAPGFYHGCVPVKQ